MSSHPVLSPHPPTTLRSPTLVATGVVKTYGTAGQGTPPALAGVDLAVAPGQSLAVMGPSGSGKTTLLHCLAGILSPTAGSVVWNGRDLGALGDAARSRLRRSQFGFVFQTGQLLPELPAVENVALPLMLDGVGRREATARADRLFAPLGLDGLQDRRPGELSGGQSQRVAIARAVVGSPGVVFADEPTGALDQTTSGEVMHHLTGLTAHAGAALVLVTHDPGVAAWCTSRVTMRDGRIESGSPVGGSAA